MTDDNKGGVIPSGGTDALKEEYVANGGELKVATAEDLPGFGDLTPEDAANFGVEIEEIRGKIDTERQDMAGDEVAPSTKIEDKGFSR